MLTASRWRGLAALCLGLFLLGLTMPTLTRAQTVRWEPPGGQLGFNQVSELALVFENCEPDGAPTLPKIDGLQFGAPSQSTEMNMVNMTVTRRFSLVFPVRPSKRSTLTIPAFEVKTDKGAITVKAATYSVGDATVGNSGLSVNDVANAKITALKDSFWAGEVFPLTYNLNIVRRYYHSIATNVDWASAPLVTEDWSKPELNEAVVRGERYVVLQQGTRAYAKQPGNYTLKPATQMVNLMVGTSGFGLFSQPTVEQRAIESDPLTLTIKPLPVAPPGFNGAVGDFSFVSKVVPLTAAVGEPVTWTLELAGTGNWPDISGLPEREVSNDFQVVQPKSKRTMKDSALFEGSLTEDVVLVPTKPGTYKLAPVRFTYFDPRSGTYKTVASEGVTVTITGSTAPVQAPPGSGAPVQFSIAPPASTSTPPHFPEAVAPAPPENLPRDPVSGPASGRIPLPAHNLAILCLASSLSCVIVAWLVLAALRSKERDPQRLRREARARLAQALATLKASNAQQPTLNVQLKAWQTEVAKLWEIPHAAPGSPLVHASVARYSADAAAAWARLWSEADRADQEQCVDQLVDAPQQVEKEPGHEVDRGVRRNVARGEQCQWRRRNDGDRRSPCRDLHGLDGRRNQRLQDREIRRHHAAEEVGHVRNAGNDIGQAEMDPGCRQPQHRAAPCHDDQADRQPPVPPRRFAGEALVDREAVGISQLRSPHVDHRSG